eukprot:1486888-Rhodomonas_salina.1
MTRGPVVAVVAVMERRDRCSRNVCTPVLRRCSECVRGEAGVERCAKKKILAAVKAALGGGRVRCVRRVGASLLGVKGRLELRVSGGSLVQHVSLGVEVGCLAVKGWGVSRGKSDRLQVGAWNVGAGAARD